MQLAQEIGGEIVNADCMQVYREMPILTAQPTLQDMQLIKHHMYGFRSVADHYSAGDFVQDATCTLQTLLCNNKTPILVGGTGMYIKVLVDGFSSAPKASQNAKEQTAYHLATNSGFAILQKVDPLYSTKIHHADVQRIRRALEVFFTTNIPYSTWQTFEKRQFFHRSDFHIIWLNPERETVYHNINTRFENMIHNGALSEVESLLQLGLQNLPKAHGLPELQAYIQGKLPLAEAVSKAQQATRNYAKRQITWAKHQFVFDEILTM